MSRSDSNRCTPYRRKSNQHATRIPRSVRVWSQTIHVSRGQRITTFCESPTDLNGSHCSREKGLPIQSLARRQTDPRVHAQFHSQANQWSSKLKSSLCWWWATRLTGLISPACDQYVKNLLAGANPSVFNQHRWELQPWRCSLSTYHSLTFPTDSLPFPPKGTAQSPV
jgi:hypothetical protein